jgi:hypothetical protein
MSRPGSEGASMWYQPRSGRDAELQRYVAWLNEQIEGDGRRWRLTRLIDDLRCGTQHIGGAQLPSHILIELQALFPELEAELEQLGGPLRPEPLPRRPPMWPERSRAEERDLQAALASVTEVQVPRRFPVASHWAVGGLLAVGLAPGTELVLVVSASGLGVFDGAGRKLARKLDADLTGYPDHVAGIGPIAGVEVRLMGCEGGTALPRTTPDGWQLGVLHPDDCKGIWLAPPHHTLEPPAVGCIRLAKRFEEIRAAGFSDSGRTLLIAEQHTLHLFQTGDPDPAREPAWSDPPYR